MTSKLDSLIAGLTMLRAYGCVHSVGTTNRDDDLLKVNIDPTIEIHADDIARLKFEGWEYDEQQADWVFECA
jgi:hypothetical protein